MKKELVDKVVESYSSLDSLYCCSYILEGEAGSFTHHIRGVCHQTLWYGGSRCKELVTSYPRKSALALRFFSFLKNKMYAEWSDYFSLETHETGARYILVTGLDRIPAPVLYNFCQASRAIIEIPYAVKRWAKLCDLGVHPVFAFAICEFDFEDEDNLIDGICDSYYYQNSNHAPIYYDCDISRLLSGPKSDAPSYAQSPKSVTPCWPIWGANNQHMRKLFGSTVREFSEQWKKDHPEDEDLLQSPG